MKIAFYLNVISPHQLPLAREVIRLIGEENFKYVYAEDFHADRKAMGWDDGDMPAWCVKGDENVPELIDADLVYTGLRCIGLMARRAAMGKKTVYYSERWFKPKLGVLRLLSASYRCMARKIVQLIEDGGVEYLSCGIHSARDMARLCGLMHGDLWCLFRAPKLEFERKPGGRIFLAAKNIKNTKNYCLDKMRMWGYFVEKSEGVKECGSGGVEDQLTHAKLTHSPTLKVLWVGRFLKLKRVDTIIRAVSAAHPLTHSPTHPLSLDIYGSGPEENHLKKLASTYGDVISFHPPVPIADVRRLMREHDVYVLSSNAYEGWGAVVSEALEEGMKVIGTYEAGSSATILPPERLYHAGDVKSLMALLMKELEESLPPCSVGGWTAKNAAEALMGLI